MKTEKHRSNMAASRNCKYMAEAQGLSERSYSHFATKQYKFILKKKSKYPEIQKYIFKRPKHL